LQLNKPKIVSGMEPAWKAAPNLQVQATETTLGYWNGNGECRRLPPSFGEERALRFAWPSTNDQDWCGEWKAASAEQMAGRAQLETIAIRWEAFWGAHDKRPVDTGASAQPGSQIRSVVLYPAELAVLPSHSATACAVDEPMMGVGRNVPRRSAVM
jgi:hypothetical protein